MYGIQITAQIYPKFRPEKIQRQEGVFVAEGPKLVKELIESKNAELTQIYALDEWIEENKDLLKDISVTAINETELERISQLTTPNKILAIVKNSKQMSLE